LHGDGPGLHEPVNLRLFLIGKTKERWLKEAISEYVARISPFLKLELVELPDASLKIAGSAEQVRSREAETCLKRLHPEDVVILLDERGLKKTSLEFSGFLTNLSERRSVVFVIGGAYGADEKLKRRADHILSLSDLTFTHQMARLILIEQIYRALMISHNRSYHNE
jgi:23S rRNA (pseudouridine1915-N3)-methyltransferase